MPPKKITAQNSTQQLFDLIRGKINIDKIIDSSQKKQNKPKKKKKSKKNFITNDKVEITENKKSNKKSNKKEDMKKSKFGSEFFSYRGENIYPHYGVGKYPKFEEEEVKIE